MSKLKEPLKLAIISPSLQLAARCALPTESRLSAFYECWREGTVGGALPALLSLLGERGPKSFKPLCLDHFKQLSGDF